MLDEHKELLLVVGFVQLACNPRSTITGVGSLMALAMSGLSLNGSPSGLTVPARASSRA